MSALDRYRPDLVLGTTPFAAAAKERGIPALYFTNQLASRPFFLSGGMAATLQFIAQSLRSGERYCMVSDHRLPYSVASLYTRRIGRCSFSEVHHGSAMASGSVDVTYPPTHAALLDAAR